MAITKSITQNILTSCTGNTIFSELNGHAPVNLSCRSLPPMLWYKRWGLGDVTRHHCFALDGLVPSFNRLREICTFSPGREEQQGGNGPKSPEVWILDSMAVRIPNKKYLWFINLSDVKYFGLRTWDEQYLSFNTILPTWICFHTSLHHTNFCLSPHWCAIE